jgi:glycine cleavage system H protein
LVVGLSIAALAAVIMLLLPLLGVFAFVGRIVALALIPAFLVGLVFSPRLRAWVDGDDAESGAEAAGPTADILFHHTHTWARVDAIDRVRVGSDDFTPLLLGAADHVMLPAVGTEVSQGEALFTVQHGDRRITLRAPVSGTVVSTNTALAEDPALLSRAPYGAGWALTLSPGALGRDKKALTPLARIGAWRRAEVDRLMACLSEPGFATMHDGGELAEDLHAQLDDVAFRRITAELFGAPK